MYFRKMSPRTRCLYSADSTLPRSLLAASKRAAASGPSPLDMFQTVTRSDAGREIRGLQVVRARCPGSRPSRREPRTARKPSSRAGDAQPPSCLHRRRILAPSEGERRSYRGQVLLRASRSAWRVWKVSRAM